MIYHHWEAAVVWRTSNAGISSLHFVGPYWWSSDHHQQRVKSISEQAVI